MYLHVTYTVINQHALIIKGTLPMPSEIKSATVQETKKFLENDTHAILIDVREKSEWDETATAIAKFFPMSQINPETFDRECQVRKDQPIFLLCRSGGRSMRVATALAEAGFQNLTNVSGGIIAWTAAGLPLKAK